MKYYVLESGSKGNCTVIKGRETLLVIDCGGTKKYIKDRFRELGLDYSKADALLITHEHSDHIKQLKMFSGVDIFSPCELYDCEIHKVTPYQEFMVGEFRILPVALSHDVKNVVGYIIDDGYEKLVSVTDTGYVSHLNEDRIRNADYYIFESNYDTGMLMSSDRPVQLKVRIVSDCGHMGNEDSARVLSRVIGERTREITLAHLSQECNKEEIALSVLKRTLEENGIDLNRFRITAARQFEMTEGGHND